LVRSPLSLIIADIVMQDLENRAMEGMVIEILFYFRYIDDKILSASTEQVNNIK